MIIYIHGFGSSGLGNKARYFREAMVDEPFLAPSLSYVPQLAMDSLVGLIETLQSSSDPLLNNVRLIGSSLGGFYALYLAERYGLKAVLINPAVDAPHLLRQVLGPAPNYHDGSHFEWQPQHVEQLADYVVETPSRLHRLLLLVQQGDDVLDYRRAVTHLSGAEMVVEEGGDHSFSGIERMQPRIVEFFGRC